MKPLRIALYHNLPSGGGKRALYEWVKRLAGMGHVLDVFTLSSADHAYGDIRPYAHAHRVYPFARKPLFKSPFGRLNHLQYWRDLRQLEHMGRVIAQDIDAGQYDLVFAHPCLLTLVPAVLQFVSTPSLYYLHEPFGPGFVLPLYRPYLTRNSLHGALNHVDPLIALYEHQLQTMRAKSTRRTTRMLANSKFTRDVVQREYDVQAEVCYYGINSADFCPNPLVVRQSHVLSVGELSARKGFDFLIESLAHVPLAQRPVLQLACNNEARFERDYISHLAAQRGVTLDIQMRLNTSQLVDAYRRASFVVYAPLLEAFGLVPLEAMACGTAVVGVREGGVCETVVHEQTGLLAERDPIQFARSIENMMQDAAQRERYGQQGCEWVNRHWSWDESTKQIEEQLMRVAEQSSQSAQASGLTSHR
jgi:glycosyltransferase involved in cell wall biosynthesis